MLEKMMIWKIFPRRVSQLRNDHKMLLLLSYNVVTCDAYLLTASRVFIRQQGAL